MTAFTNNYINNYTMFECSTYTDRIKIFQSLIINRIHSALEQKVCL